MRLSLANLLVFSSCLFSSADASKVKLSPPAEAPSDASPVVNNFVALSIAIHWFRDYTRQDNGSAPNTFTRNLLGSLKNSSGISPEIRIGGTSADRTTYVVSQEEPILTVSGTNGIPTNVTIGKKWFTECFDRQTFPDGTEFIFDLPLMRNDSLSIPNTLQGAEWAIDVIEKDRFKAFEIGNEEDLYPGAVTPSNFTVVDYVDRWRNFSRAVQEDVLDPRGFDSPSFQALAFASITNDNWTTQKAFDAGVNDDGFVKSVSLHNYPAGNADWVDLARTFMNHDAIVANLSRVVDDIAFVQDQPDPMKFVLGETNIDFVNLNMEQFEGVLGSALWTIDYLLYGASIGVERMYLHQGTTFGYSAWKPVPDDTSPSKVRPPWYGLKFVADAIGSHPGAVNVAHLPILEGANGTQDPHLSAYGIWESNTLARLAIVNFNFWDPNDTSSPRPNTTFSLELPSGPNGTSDVQKVSAMLVTGPGARADTNIQFGGVVWNYTTNGLPHYVGGPSRPKDVQVINGTVELTVEYSQAMLVTLYGSKP